MRVLSVFDADIRYAIIQPSKREITSPMRTRRREAAVICQNSGLTVRFNISLNTELGIGTISSEPPPTRYATIFAAKNQTATQKITAPVFFARLIANFFISLC
jgi:hypothetical protein